MSKLSELIAVAKDIRPLFESFDVKPVAGGILASEMLLFLAAVKYHGIRNVIESGRRNGYSTAILGECIERCKLLSVASIEIDPIEAVDDALEMKYRHLALVKGDGEREVPKMYARMSLPTALLLDGPKGPKAANLADRCNPPLFAIHDCHRWHEGGVENPWRKEAERRYPNAIFSDDDLWLEEFCDLDRDHWRKDYSSRAEMTAAGLTLMVVTK